MENMNIKFGVFKYLDKEETIDTFFSKMNLLIKDDVINNYVRRNQVDYCYDICIDGKVFRLKYEEKDFATNDDYREANYRLNLLAEYTLREEKNLEKSTYDSKKETKKIIDDAKNRILREHEYNIESLNRQEKNFKEENDANVFEDTFEKIKEINLHGVEAVGVRIGFGVFGFAGAFAALLAALSSPAYFGISMAIMAVGLVFGIDMVSALVSESNDWEYSGLLPTLYSIVVSPLILGYHICKKIINKIKHNKKMKPLRDFVSKVESIKKIMSMEENVDSKIKTVDVKKINALKEKIKEVENEDARKEFGQELQEIAKYYLEVLNNYNKDNREQIMETIDGQIKDLSEKVEKAISDQMNKALSSNYYNLMAREGNDTEIEEEKILQKKLENR